MGMYHKVSDCLVLQNDSLVSQDETLVSGEGGNLLLGSKCYTVMWFKYNGHLVWIVIIIKTISCHLCQTTIKIFIRGTDKKLHSHTVNTTSCLDTNENTLCS